MSKTASESIVSCEGATFKELPKTRTPSFISRRLRALRRGSGQSVAPRGTEVITADDPHSISVPFPVASPTKEAASLDIRPLPKPIAIPRLSPGSSIPFARCWAPALSSLGVEQSDFMAFVDTLNILTSPHPTVTIIQMAALGLGFAPVDHAAAISTALGLTAEGLQIAITRVQVNRFLLAANKSYWHTRGVHVRVLGTKRLRTMLGINKKEKLALSLNEEIADLTALERCVRGLERWCCELVVDPELLPKPAVGGKGANIFEKAAAFRVRWKVKEANGKAKMHRKRQMKRKAKGKKIRVDHGENFRIRLLDWVVLQSLEDYEREVEERERLKAERREKGLASRVMSWKTEKSAPVVEKAKPNI